MCPSSGDDARPDKDRPGKGGVSRTLGDDFALYSGLGVQLGVVITAFTLGGNWLDARLGTKPWFLLLGTLVGFVGGTISVVSRVPSSASGSRKERGGP